MFRKPCLKMTTEIPRYQVLQHRRVISRYISLWAAPPGRMACSADRLTGTPASGAAWPPPPVPHWVVGTPGVSFSSPTGILLTAQPWWSVSAPLFEESWEPYELYGFRELLLSSELKISTVWCKCFHLSRISYSLMVSLNVSSTFAYREQ